MNNPWHNRISEQFFAKPHDQIYWHQSLAVDGTLLLTAILGSVISYWVARKLVFGLISRVVQKTESTWDDELLNSKLFKWLSLLLPAVIILTAAPHAIITHHDGVPIFSSFIQI